MQFVFSKNGWSGYYEQEYDSFFLCLAGFSNVFGFVFRVGVRGLKQPRSFEKVTKRQYGTKKRYVKKA
jgi:hypothetical protein